MWHVNNEYGCHNLRCYCEVSAAAFRQWLQDRYEMDLAALNTAWGTAFWSQHYSDWSQVSRRLMTANYCSMADKSRRRGRFWFQRTSDNSDSFSKISRCGRI